MQPRFDIILKKKSYRDQIQFWHKQKNQTKKFKLNTLRYSYTVFFFFFFHYSRVPFMLGMQALKY